MWPIYWNAFENAEKSFQFLDNSRTPDLLTDTPWLTRAFTAIRFRNHLERLRVS